MKRGVDRGTGSAHQWLLVGLSIKRIGEVMSKAGETIDEIINAATRRDAELSIKLAEGATAESRPYLMAHMGSAFLHAKLAAMVAKAQMAGKPIELMRDWLTITVKLSSRSVRITHGFRGESVDYVMESVHPSVKREWRPEGSTLGDVDAQAHDVCAEVTKFLLRLE